MLKKASGGSKNLKEQTDKLKVKLDKNITFAAELIKQTGMPVTFQSPPESVLQHLAEECEDHRFWLNFKSVAPQFFCRVIDENAQMRQVRELSYTEELLKTKGLIDAMLAKINASDDIDITEYLLAVNQLENKMKILKALSNPLSDEDNKLKFTIESREVVVDMTKLKDAITYLDNEVEEKQASAEDSMTKITHIDYTKMTENEYITRAVDLIGVI